MKTLPVAVCLWLLLPTAAGQTVGLAASAIEHHNGVSLHNWRFDRLSAVDDQLFRERCKGVDFHKAECRLLTVDDEPADDAAQQKYREKNPQPIEENLPNLDPTDFINVETLALVKTDDDTVHFSFDGAADSAEDYENEGRLKGVMVVDREGGYIRSLQLSNSETFKPAVGVKIKTLRVDVQFESVQDTAFANQVSMAMQGRAFGLKKLEQDQVVSFENFTPPQ